MRYKSCARFPVRLLPFTLFLVLVLGIPESYAWAPLFRKSYHPDYSLKAFENDDFRDLGWQELEASLGEERELLRHYRCRNGSQVDPFRAPFRSNPYRTSLRVKLKKEGDTYFYRAGHFYTLDGFAEVEPKDDFFSSLASALKMLETYPSGARLLRSLEEAYFPLYFQKGGNRFIPYFDPVAEDRPRPWEAGAIVILERMRSDVLPTQVGIGGVIYWNPAAKVTRVESDGVKRAVPAEIALAHEMFHAFDGNRGILDPRFVVGPDSEISPHYQMAEVREYRAVYFENLVRKEAGLNYSKYYGNVETGPSMLDREGRPVLIPEPCVNNAMR